MEGGSEFLEPQESREERQARLMAELEDGKGTDTVTGIEFEHIPYDPYARKKAAIRVIATTDKGYDVLIRRVEGLSFTSSASNKRRTAFFFGQLIGKEIDFFTQPIVTQRHNGERVESRSELRARPKSLPEPFQQKVDFNTVKDYWNSQQKPLANP